jgi:ERCC4-type nuclease
MGHTAELMTLPQSTGSDYLITNTYGSTAIQRKVAPGEFVSEIDEILERICPRLISFSNNPGFIVEECFNIDENGYLVERNTGRESQMLAISYYGILETIRKMGIDVYTTRDLNHTIWLLAAMDTYLGSEHLPKHRKYHSNKEVAMGMLAMVPGVGEKRAAKALQHSSIGMMYRMRAIKGLNATQVARLFKIMSYREDAK